MARRSAAARRILAEEPATLSQSRNGRQRAEPHYADVGEVAAFAAELPEKFLHCRELSHTWRPFDVGRHRDGGFERTIRCTRCRAKKVQHLDASGMLLGSKMEYPKGYLHEGLGRIIGEGRGALRLASISRIKDVNEL